MHFQLPVSSFLLSLAIGSAVAKPFARIQRDAAPSTNSTGSSANNQALIAQLLTTATMADRYKLLQPDDFLYDFNNGPEGTVTTSNGGHTVKADRKAFPALIGNGVSMTVGFIGPCGFNTPHVHPRASEFNIVVKGTLHSEFITENGFTPVSHDASEFQAVIFPKGSVHTEFNPSCDPAVFVAAFGDEDPGVQQSAQTFFGLDPDITTAALGGDSFLNGQDIDTFRAAIPANVANGVEQCLQTCGIQKRDRIA